jgi:hypothetical protein
MVRDKEAIEGLRRTDGWDHMSSAMIANGRLGSLDRKNGRRRSRHVG